MNRLLPFAAGAIGLFLLGSVVGNRADGGGAAQPLPQASRAMPTPRRNAPTLAGVPDCTGSPRTIGSEEFGELAKARAERDRIAAELAELKDREKRWAPLAELEIQQRGANERSAIVTARHVASALVHVQEMALIDEDGDGIAEFAGFLEMAGGGHGRIATGRPLMPPLMPSAFKSLTRNGEAYQSGYLYRVYLPDARGNGIGEGPEGFAPLQVDTNLAEAVWCMYAWPVVSGETGQKVFFCNQTGVVLATEDSRYAGPGNGPAADAAFTTPGITGQAGGRGSDGNMWVELK